MKFLLHQGLGYSTVHQIGDYLRSHGTGNHWIERYRGSIFVIVSDQADEMILRNEFSGLLDAVTKRRRTDERKSHRREYKAEAGL